MTVRLPQEAAPPSTHADARATVLQRFGAAPDDLTTALAALGEPFGAFSAEAVRHGDALPWSDEPFVATWQQYAHDAAVHPGGVLAVLQSRLPQLAFPIAAGTSTRSDYLAATKRGHAVARDMTRQAFRDPLGARLTLHETAVGRLPVLVIPERLDFETLVRAFVHRSEPVPVPSSVGACLVAGYNNWDRIAQHRQRWARAAAAAGTPTDDAAWAIEFRVLTATAAAYQDRFMLLSEGPYSNTAAESLGLEPAAWRSLSLRIRLEHECAHYTTRRLFGAMRQTVLDEMLADYVGVARASGQFNAAWFLRFLGLEQAPAYREGGRLQNYVDTGAVSAATRDAMYAIIVAAAHTLAAVDARRASAGDADTLTSRTATLIAIARLGVEMLALPSGVDQLTAAVATLLAASDSGAGESPSPSGSRHRTAQSV